MSKVVLSAGVRQNLLALQNTAHLMGITQNRLATGKKVNSALDNPVNYFTASGLHSRAGDLSALLDAMSTGIKTIEAADNGITAINTAIESMKSTLLQARQDKSFKSSAYTIDATTIGTTTLKNLSFTGGAVGTTPVNIPLNGIGVATTLTGAGSTFGTNFTGGTITANGTNVTIRGDVAAVASSVTGVGGTDLTGNPDLSALDGESITITAASGGFTATYAFTNSATGQAAALETALETNGFTVTRTAAGLSISRADGIEFTVDSTAAGVDAVVGIADNTTTINGTEAFDATAATVEADFDGAGITGLTAAVVGGEVELTLASGADLTLAGANTLLTAIGFAAGNRTSTNGSTSGVMTVDQLVAAINSHASLIDKVQASNDNGRLRIMNESTGDLTVTGVTGTGTVDGGVGTNIVGGNQVRRNLVKQFNDLRDQLDKLAQDASFNGVNLLRGDKLKITFNETGTSTIEIQATDENGVVRPIDSMHLSIVYLQNSDVDADANIDVLLESLTHALNAVRAQASDFGSNLSVVENRTSFTKAMINTLQTGGDNLVLADTNEEGANMLALQTRQQLSTTALSLSAQADQAVLRLFG